MPELISRDQHAVVQLLLRTGHQQLGLRDLLKQALDIVCRKAHLDWVEMASVYLLEDNQLERVASFDLSLELDARSRQLSEADTPAWQVVSGQALVWRLAPEQIEAACDILGYETCLIPLYTESAALGLFVLYCRPDAPARERRQTDFLELLASVLSTLIFQKRSEARLARSHRLLQGVAKLERTFITQDQNPILFEEMLAELLELTGSRIGFIGRVLQHEDGTPYITTLAHSKIVWDSSHRPGYEPFVGGGLNLQDLNTLFGAVLTSGEPVISNDPLNDALSQGLTAGHPPLRTFLGIPFSYGNRLIGLACLANRPGGYSQDQLEELAPLIATCASLLELHNSHALRHQQALELKASEANLRALLNNTTDAVWAIDRERRIWLWNDSFARFCQRLESVDIQAGMLPEDVLSKPDCQTYWRGIYDRALAGESLNGRTLDLAAYPDINLNTAFSISPIIIEQEVIGATIYLKDITEVMAKEKRNEEFLIQAKEEAEKASQIKSLFLAKMSHELRTPLHAILGFTQLALKKNLTQGQPLLTDYLQRLRSNGRMLLEIINDILDLAQIESGKIHIERQDVLLPELIAEVLNSLELQIQAKGLVIECQLPDGLVPLNTDPLRLKQILLNLIGNALKFTDQGKIRLCVLALEGVCQSIEIQDTGSGIPADKQSQIFEAFEQGDNSHSRRYGGVGLGISISQVLCRHLGYELRLKHSDSQGSTFEIALI